MELSTISQSKQPMEQTVSQPAIQGAHPLSDRLKSTSLPMTTWCTLRHQQGTLLSEDHHLLVIQLHNSHLMLCTGCSPNTEDLARHSKGGLVETQLSTTFENRCLARQPFQSGVSAFQRICPPSNRADFCHFHRREKGPDIGSSHSHLSGVAEMSYSFCL